MTCLSVVGLTRYHVMICTSIMIPFAEKTLAASEILERAKIELLSHVNSFGQELSS